MDEVVIAEWKLEDKPTPKPPRRPAGGAAARAQGAAEGGAGEGARAPAPARQPPAPVKGDFVAPRPPDTRPWGIPAPDPNARPITQVDVNGIGKEGDVVGTVDSTDTRALTGHTEPAPSTPEPAPARRRQPASDEPMAESEVDVRPSLRNADDVQRALERAYPPSLRDAGVTGRPFSSS